MIGVKVAVQTKCLAQPLRQALHTIGGLGCEGVQIDLRHELPAAELSATALRQLRKLLDDLNLRVGSVAFPTRHGYADASGLERRLEATLQAMHAASRLAARVMLITLGPLPAPETMERTTLLEALATLAGHGNRLGVELAAQSSGAPPKELKNFLDELPEGAIGVDLSPADLILSGQSPRTFASTLGRQVVHLFANDAVRGVGGGGDVELGRGTADFPELLAMLEEYDYRGWLTIERRHSTRPVEDAVNAIQFLRSI